MKGAATSRVTGVISNTKGLVGPNDMQLTPQKQLQHIIIKEWLHEAGGN